MYHNITLSLNTPPVFFPTFPWYIVSGYSSKSMDRRESSSRKAWRRMPSLISSGKINSVSRNENSARSLSLSLHTLDRSSILCARSEEERSRREARIGFDSWGARPGIFLIHNRRVTHCHVARGVIEIAPL